MEFSARICGDLHESVLAIQRDRDEGLSKQRINQRIRIMIDVVKSVPRMKADLKTKHDMYKLKQGGLDGCPVEGGGKNFRDCR